MTTAEKKEALKSALETSVYMNAVAVRLHDEGKITYSEMIDRGRLADARYISRLDFLGL